MVGQFWAERPILGLLIAFMILDVISGTLAAFVTKTLSSSVSWVGGAKKALTLIIVTAAYLAESILEIPAGRLTAMFFSVTEVLSILENATRCGIPIPDVLKISLVKARPQSTELAARSAERASRGAERASRGAERASRAAERATDERTPDA